MIAKSLGVSLIDDHFPNTDQIVAKMCDRPGCGVFAFRPSQSVPDLPTPFYIQWAVGGVSTKIVPHPQFQVIDRKLQNSHGSVGGGPSRQSA